MDELERYRRRQKARWAALRRLGVTNVACICGETDPICFDVEHVVRALYDKTLVWGMCANCHRKKSMREQLEHPPVGVHPGDPFEKMGHALLSMNQIESLMAEQRQLIADVIFKLAGKGIAIED